MTQLNEFFKKNSGVIWPALCLASCGLAVYLAVKQSVQVKVNDNRNGTIILVKDNRDGDFHPYWKAHNAQKTVVGSEDEA